MSDPPPTLDYARPEPARSAGQFRLVAVAVCFAVAWSAALAVGVASYDPFDDDLIPWLTFFVAGLGTPCGATLAAAVSLAFFTPDAWFGE